MTISRLQALWLAALLATAPACTRPPVPPLRAPAGGSIFALDLPLVDQDGRTLRLADLSGHTTVAAMIYTSCTSVCPMVTEDMKTIERQLGRRAAGVTFVLFSLDPGRDTPAALHQFAAQHQLDLSRWRLLAASGDGVRDLAAVLGVKYRRDPDGTIAHAAMIFVIDAQGVVRHRQTGLTQDTRALIAAIG
jgi:protein SCO1/2